MLRRKSKVQRRSKIIALRKLKSALRRRQRSRRSSDGSKGKLCGSGSDGYKLNKDILFFTEKLKLETLTPLTKTIFTSFFNKFKANQVRIEDTNIEKTDFTTLEPNYVFSHMYDGIRNHIKTTMTETYKYTTTIKERECNISITTDGKNESIKQYIYMMVFWLNIVSQFTDVRVCNNSPLQIFVFLTDLKKELPLCSVDCKIKKTFVNTGYSSQCSHIVIYRKEEWFKVFIHETIHNYGLDFSPIDTNCYEVLLKYFGIEKTLQLKLFEAYTESWAKILNCLLLAFDEEQTNLDKFINTAQRNIQIEQLFSYYQVCKILKYMNLSFGSMTSYEEETAVISYYFIGSILLSDYQNYMKWCHENNDRNSLLQFDKNVPDKKHLFCEYIMSKCGENSAFINGIKQFKETFESGINFNDTLQITMKKTLLCRACEI